MTCSPCSTSIPAAPCIPCIPCTHCTLGAIGALLPTLCACAPLPPARQERFGAEAEAEAELVAVLRSLASLATPLLSNGALSEQARDYTYYAFTHMPILAILGRGRHITLLYLYGLCYDCHASASDDDHTFC